MDRTLEGSRGRSLFGIAALSFLILLSRKPDAVLNAQFWAEDGVVWYRQAYELGWQCLLLPQNGYFQTVSKLIALLSLPVALAHAPLLFNLAALSFRILPVVLLNSARGCGLVPHAGARLLASFLYLAHPYSFEVFANVTNIHWHLALSALLVLCMGSWEGGWRKAFDVALVALCGLSGPFALFLAPVALWRWHRERSRRSFALLAIIAAAAAIQVLAIAMTSDATRTAAPLGASWAGLVRIVGGQVAAAGLLGNLWATTLFHAGAWQHGIALPLAGALLVAGVFARTLLVPDRLLSGLLFLGTAIFAAALVAPQISSTEIQWPLFMRPGTGGRYAFIPIVAFHGALLWLAFRDRRRVVRWPARLLLATVLLVAIPASWVVRPYADLDFRSHAMRFEAAPPGTVVAIPINPVGWTLKLRKHEARD